MGCVAWLVCFVLVRFGRLFGCYFVCFVCWFAVYMYLGYGLLVWVCFDCWIADCGC